MAFSLPGGTNAFVLNHEATDGLIVGFSRNIKDFAINRYMELRPVTKMVGVYLRWKSEQAARIRYNDGRQNAWPIGADRPSGADNLEAFEYEYYRAQRQAYSTMLGQETIDQADWSIQPSNRNVVAQQAMTDRTLQAVGALTTGFTGSANAAFVSIDAGTPNILPTAQTWANGTSAAPNIKTCIQFGSIAINQKTLGTVKPKDLVLVMSPDSATTISQSPEIIDLLKQSPVAFSMLRGDEEQFNSEWGLPNQLYGVNLVIEDAVQITTRQLATTQTFGYALPKGTAYLLSRPGKLVGMEGSPAFSTLTGFFYEEFTVESFSDANNRRVQDSVVSNYQIQVTSDKSGFQFKNCFG